MRNSIKTTSIIRPSALQRVVITVVLTGATAPAVALDIPGLDYRGNVQLEYSSFPTFIGYQNGETFENPNQANQNLALKLDLTGSYQFSDSVSGTARPFIREDRYDPDRDVARMDEAWLQYRAENWDVRVGNQLVTWGSVESVSPLDVINPRDYEEDIVEPRKIGIPAVRLGYHPGFGGEFDYYWLPYFQPSQFEGAHSYYAIGGGIQTSYPESTWEGGQWAARYFYPGDGYDAGLSYISGLENNAGFQFDPAKDVLEGYTYWSHRLGFEGTKVIGGWLLKSEVVYRTSEVEGDKKAALYALGSEYTFNSIWSHADLTLITEYLACSHNVQNDELEHNDLFYAARMAVNDLYKQNIEFGMFFDFDHHDHVYRMSYQFSPIDSVDMGVRWTDTRNYFPGPYHVEDLDNVFYLFTRYNF